MSDITIPRELLDSLIDAENCSFDHHGGCQEHGYISLKPGELCPHEDVKRRLAEKPEPMSEQTRAALEFGEAMHATLTRLKKAERAAARATEYADSAVAQCNEYVRNYNDAHDELTRLRAALVEMGPAEQAHIEAETSKPPIKPLRCIACDFQPDPAFTDREGTYQPSGATAFSSSGHYGSTVWDPMSGGVRLLINVCDTCLVERRDRTVVEYEIHRKSDVEYRTWNPHEDNDD